MLYLKAHKKLDLEAPKNYNLEARRRVQDAIVFRRLQARRTLWDAVKVRGCKHRGSYI